MVIFACPLFKWNEKSMKNSQTACPAAAAERDLPKRGRGW